MYFRRGYHSGHNCDRGGGRGAWKLRRGDDEGGDAKIDACAVMRELLDAQSDFARQHKKVMPPARALVYGGHAALKEKTRLELWRLGVAVVDAPDALCEWCEARPRGPAAPPRPRPTPRRPPARRETTTTAAAAAAAAGAAGRTDDAPRPSGPPRLTRQNTEASGSSSRAARAR